MDNIYVKKVSFTKTNDKNLPYNDLYYDWTGHEFECIGDSTDETYNDCILKNWLIYIMIVYIQKR